MQEALGNITIPNFPTLYRKRGVGFIDWNFLTTSGHVPSTEKSARNSH